MDFFLMKDFESINKVFAKFMKIMNGLQALGKTYTKVESHEDFEVFTKEMGG